MVNLSARKQIRSKNYNYSTNGWYFITVCSKNRNNVFGQYEHVVGAGLASARNRITLSVIGKIIDDQWNKIPEKYDNIELDQYIIMPNHLHGILTIKNRADARPAPTISDIICSFKSLCTKMNTSNTLNKKI